MRSLHSATLPIPTQDHPPLIVRGALQLFQPLANVLVSTLVCTVRLPNKTSNTRNRPRRQRRRQAAEDESVGVSAERRRCADTRRMSACVLPAPAWRSLRKRRRRATHAPRRGRAGTPNPCAACFPIIHSSDDSRMIDRWWGAA